MTDLLSAAATSDQRVAGPSSGAGQRESRGGSILGIVGPPLVVFGVFVGLWYLYSTIIGEKQRKISLPYAHDVWSEAFANGSNLAELLSATWVSTKVALVGLAIAMLIGITVAVLMHQAGWIERSLYPYAVLLQTVPILALVPLIGLRWGYGFTSRIIVCVIISLFPIITNTLFGLKSTEAGHQDLFRLHGASRLTRLVKLNLPGAMPAMFTGFRISAGLSVIGAIVGDFFFGRGERGLGIRIRDYSNNFEPEMVIGGIIFAAILGLAVFQFFGVLGRVFTGSWHESGKESGTGAQ